ncbi:Uncharacterized protein TCM_031247 [Theobroma cacao]|uniref:Uncharacterized protein n=1 Tax=Theobroma cacao TaxID=3641 RepID=A0A061F7S2_THECC|nr:Uncharacterized protein TCM_031247 [Theobroma cacao]
MAPQRSKLKSSYVFDRSKFISINALVRYHTSLINKVSISKKRLNIPLIHYEEIHQMIEEQHLERCCELLNLRLCLW